MKHNPTCQRADCPKEFSDNLNFCNMCGERLSVKEEQVDLYKTTVASKDEILGAIPVESGAAAPIALDLDDDILQLPEEHDPKKTMVATPDEMRREFAAATEDEIDELVDIPLANPEPVRESAPVEVVSEPAPTPYVEPAAQAEPKIVEPEPPRFNEPTPAAPSFEDISVAPPMVAEPDEDLPETVMAPPVAFETPSSPFDELTPSQPSQTPIPSPFEMTMPPVYTAPTTPPFGEPQPAPNAAPFDHFQNSPADQWTPPPAPVAQWQEQGVGQQTPFQPPAVTNGGVNQTLPIVSLILGIVSLCCYISPITGIAALITGYKGMKNAKNDPQNYGGHGLAVAGMILGGIFLVVGLLYWLYIIFVIGLVAFGNLG